MTIRFNVRKLTILAQDPGVRVNHQLLFTQVDVPYEDLADGPIGYRVKVVDFDASANVLYQPLKLAADSAAPVVDKYAPPMKMKGKARRDWENELLADPAFHAQNVYAIVMRTLARFEYALGRRVEWGFEGHQLHVAPHAFCEANAFYSEADKALFFGYFNSAKTGNRVFTCLSHDIIAHETTHALLDGIRDGFTSASTPDQAAFHEGFADVVALLSVFSLPETMELAVTKGKKIASTVQSIRLVSSVDVSEAAILDSFLLGLGKEFGASLDDEGARADCLRRSAKIKPSRKLLNLPGNQEPHARGEIFAAVMLRSFVALWMRRIQGLGTFADNHYNLDMVLEEGSRAAEHLLTMAIRALDYCPPVDLTFGAYLSALLTADMEVSPDDTRFSYRTLLQKVFASFGVNPSALRTDPETGCWNEFDQTTNVVYYRNHFESMLHDKDEVFRFLWENRRVLNIDDRGYLRICSVRASVRQGPDGFFLRETICEYVQVSSIFAAELGLLKLIRPEGMPTTQYLTVYGGGTLVFDQYGRIKYHIEHRLDDVERQSERLKYLWENGLLDQAKEAKNPFATMHRDRVSQ